MKKRLRDGGERVCFVVMPFAGESRDFFEKVIKPTVEEEGFRCFRADDLAGPARIYDAIIQAIADADLLIVDTSSSNPNVFYELGVAHSLGKPVILMSQDVGSLPFDLRFFRVLTYDLRLGATVLRRQLKKAIGEVIAETPPKPLSGLVAKLRTVAQRDVEALTKETESLRAAVKERDQRIEQYEALRTHRETRGADLVPIADELRVLFRQLSDDLFQKTNVELLTARMENERLRAELGRLNTLEREYRTLKNSLVGEICG